MVTLPIAHHGSREHLKAECSEDEDDVYYVEPKRKMRTRPAWVAAILVSFVVVCIVLQRNYDTDTLSSMVKSVTSTSHQVQQAACQLASPDYAGLSPDFVVPPDDLRRFHKDQDQNQTWPLESDFRQIRYATSPGPTDKQYEGFTCISHFPSQICPTPGQCAPPADDAAAKSVKEEGACMHWATGRLANPLELDFETNLKEAKAAIRLDDQWDTDGEWDGEQWTPTENGKAVDQAYRFFTPRDMHQCLAGKRILIQGDSMMRQLFNRLVHWSREIPTAVDHYHWMDSVYTLYLNGTDSWTREWLGNPAQYGPDKDKEQGVLYRVIFDWHNPDKSKTDNSNELYEAFEVLQKYDIDLGIIGFNYWYGLEYPLSRTPAALDKFYATTGWDGILSWYTTPEQSPDQKDAWWYVGHNARMRTVAKDRKERDNRKITVIPSDKMVLKIDAFGRPQRNCYFDSDTPMCGHDAHFGCGTIAHYPNPVSEGINGIKAPLGYDCRDVYNLAVLQNWLNSVCPL